MRSFEVHILCVRSNHVSVDVAHNLKHLVVVVHRVLEVVRSIVVLPLVLEVALFKFHDALHHGVFHVELYLRDICI